MRDSLSIREMRTKVMRDCITKTCQEHQADSDEILAGKALSAGWEAWHSLKPDVQLEHRSLRERALTGLRLMATDLQRSMIVRLFSSLGGCGEIVEKALVYASRVHQLTRMGLLIERHETRYDQARNRAIELGHDDGLCSLYSSLKTWSQDSDLDAYIKQLADLENLKLELVIEGPLQLVLSLSDDGLMAIFRLPLWNGLASEEPEMRDVRDTVLALREKVRAEWEDGWLSSLAVIATAAIEQFQEEIKNELKAFRGLVPQDSRQRFIVAFENGEYRDKEAPDGK